MYRHFRYDVRIVLPMLPMLRVGPWFVESTYLDLPEAEARYELLLPLAQGEAGSIELVKLEQDEEGDKRDLEALRWWSSSHLRAYGMRADPLGSEGRSIVEAKLAEVNRRLADGVPLLPEPRSVLKPARPPRRPSPVPIIGAGLAAACLLVGIGVVVGRSTATPPITGAMLGLTAPRLCAEYGSEARVARLWTEHPQMTESELIALRNTGPQRQQIGLDKELQRLFGDKPPR
jgi:hypothetical protein